MKCFYHSGDLDGHCAGAILKKRFPDAEIIGYNYFYQIDKSVGKIIKDEPVIFADITPVPEHLKVVMSLTSDITIIDHHSSSLDDLNQAGLSFPGIVKPGGIGACVLTWQWCFPELEVPLGVRYIGEYDDWQRTPENIYFHFGIRTFSTFPGAFIWDDVLNNKLNVIDKLVTTGNNVSNYLFPWYKKLIRSYGIEGSIDGHSTLFINQPNVDSSIFDSVDGSFDYYIRAVFGKSLEWLISITTDRNDLDVSEIARKYGGGGRKKTAGFRVKSIKEFFTPN